MSDKYNVSASPHVRSRMTTSTIMFLVIISLLPATGYGIYHFGFNAALLVAVSIASCVLTELLYTLLLRQRMTIPIVNCLLLHILPR